MQILAKEYYSRKNISIILNISPSVIKIIDSSRYALQTSADFIIFANRYVTAHFARQRLNNP